MSEKKRILIISPHFHPENFKCNDVAFELARRGHEVTVLSDIPNYPGGKYFKGYSVFKRRKEVVNGVKIYRTLMTPRGDGSGKMLALNYVTWAATASLRALWWCVSRLWDKSKRFDEILVHETSPVTVGIPAVILKKLGYRGTKLLFWVLDLWPESMQVAGGIDNKAVLGVFEGITKWIYRNSDKILMSSKGFRDSICEKGDFADKLEYFPNWAEDALTAGSDYQLPECIAEIKANNGFIVMFTGNIGEAQDFDNTLEAMYEVAQMHYKSNTDTLEGRQNAEYTYFSTPMTNIHLVLVGDGRKRPWVEEYVREHHLEDTVHWVGRHPLEAMGKFFSQADVLYFALKDSLIFNLTCPAKLQAYMSAGKPILAMINGEGRNIVAEAGCGLSVAAGDSKVLAQTIVKMANIPNNELSVMGMKGKNYCKENFSFEKNMEKLESLF